MTTSVYDLGRVEVSGELDPGALAGDIAADAHERVAEALTLTVDHLEEDGRGLNQLQKIKLAESFLRCLDGFERATLDALMNAIDRAKRVGGESDG